MKGIYPHINKGIVPVWATPMCNAREKVENSWQTFSMHANVSDSVSRQNVLLLLFNGAGFRLRVMDWRALWRWGTRAEPCLWVIPYLGLPLFWQQAGTCHRGHDVIECGQCGEQQEQGLMCEGSKRFIWWPPHRVHVQRRHRYTLDDAWNGWWTKTFECHFVLLQRGRVCCVCVKLWLSQSEISN